MDETPFTTGSSVTAYGSYNFNPLNKIEIPDLDELKNKVNELEDRLAKLEKVLKRISIRDNESISWNEVND